MICAGFLHLSSFFGLLFEGERAPTVSKRFLVRMNDGDSKGEGYVAPSLLAGRSMYHTCGPDYLAS